MIEKNTSANIEAEIAELSARIEEKRRELEKENNIVPDDKATVKAVVASFVPAATLPAGQAGGPTAGEDASYLDHLPSEVAATVDELVQKVFDRGLAKTIAEARRLPALDLDAFHDTLTDKVYDELKGRGLVT